MIINRQSEKKAKFEDEPASTVTTVGASGINVVVNVHCHKD